MQYLDKSQEKKKLFANVSACKWGLCLWMFMCLSVCACVCVFMWNTCKHLYECVCVRLSGNKEKKKEVKTEGKNMEECVCFLIGKQKVIQSMADILWERTGVIIDESSCNIKQKFRPMRIDEAERMLCKICLVLKSSLVLLYSEIKSAGGRLRIFISPGVNKIVLVFLVKLYP